MARSSPKQGESPAIDWCYLENFAFFQADDRVGCKCSADQVSSPLALVRRSTLPRLTLSASLRQAVQRVHSACCAVTDIPANSSPSRRGSRRDARCGSGSRWPALRMGARGFVARTKDGWRSNPPDFGVIDMSWRVGELGNVSQARTYNSISPVINIQGFYLNLCLSDFGRPPPAINALRFSPEAFRFNGFLR